MGWSESYYADMAGEAGRELEERLRDLAGALRRMRLAASTYQDFHPLIGGILRLVDGWEAELEIVLREHGGES